MCMNFIWIGSRAPENQTRLLSLFERGIFAQNMVLRPTQSSAVTMATIICRFKYGCCCSSPQVTYLHTKIEGGLKFFISNFASLSWRTALNPLSPSLQIRRNSLRHSLRAKVFSTPFRLLVCFTYLTNKTIRSRQIINTLVFMSKFLLQTIWC